MRKGPDLTIERTQKEASVSQDKNETAQEFMKEVVDDLGYTPKGERNQRSMRSGDLRPGSGFLIPAGIVILLLIAIIAFFLTGRTDGYREDFAAIQSGLNRLEERLARLDGLEDRVTRLEKEAKKLLQSVKNITARNVKTYKKKPSSPVKKRYHTVRAGDSLYSIAKKYGISTDKLCRLNKITPKKPLQPGQRLLVGG